MRRRAPPRYTAERRDGVRRAVGRAARTCWSSTRRWSPSTGCSTSRTPAGRTAARPTWGGWCAWTVAASACPSRCDPRCRPWSSGSRTWVRGRRGRAAAGRTWSPTSTPGWWRSSTPRGTRTRWPGWCWSTATRPTSAGPDYPYGLDEATTRDLIEGAVDPARASRWTPPSRWSAPSLAGDAGFRAWWTRIGRRAPARARPRTIRTVASRTDLRPRLADVEVPVLVVHRRQCTNVDPGHSRYLAEHLPDAELGLVDGVDGVWFSRPDGCRRRGGGFVAEVNHGGPDPPPLVRPWAGGAVTSCNLRRESRRRTATVLPSSTGRPPNESKIVADAFTMSSLVVLRQVSSRACPGLGGEVDGLSTPSAPSTVHASGRPRSATLPTVQRLAWAHGRGRQRVTR